jgi:hypothetical protein
LRRSAETAKERQAPGGTMAPSMAAAAQLPTDDGESSSAVSSLVQGVQLLKLDGAHGTANKPSRANETEVEVVGLLNKPTPPKESWENPILITG